jgi:biotin carboxyl carrier protein
MHQLKVNGSLEYKVEKNDGQLLINDVQVSADIQQLNASVYHILNDLKSYNVEVIGLNKEAKTAEIKVNGTTYTVTAKDRFDILLDQLGMGTLNTTKVSEIKAPMPGLVLKLFVTEGTAVQKGDNLFILEAMKMENIIKSPADVVVKTVKIKPGDKVEQGQVLLVFQ